MSLKKDHTKVLQLFLFRFINNIFSPSEEIASVFLLSAWLELLQNEKDNEVSIRDCDFMPWGPEGLSSSRPGSRETLGTRLAF